jgi:DNA-binding response OmpR family regulator
MAKRILIVEDDKAIARLLRDNLEYEVSSSSATTAATPSCRSGVTRSGSPT